MYSVDSGMGHKSAKEMTKYLIPIEVMHLLASWPKPATTPPSPPPPWPVEKF